MLDYIKSTHLLALLERGKRQLLKVNKARNIVSCCLSMIFGIKKTIKISMVKPTIDFKSPFSYNNPQTISLNLSLERLTSSQPQDLSLALFPFSCPPSGGGVNE